MFLVTTEWRSRFWPDDAEKISRAGLVFFRRGALLMEIHKDVLFGNAGKIMSTVDANHLAYRYCNDPRSRDIASFFPDSAMQR